MAAATWNFGFVMKINSLWINILDICGWISSLNYDTVCLHGSVHRRSHFYILVISSTRAAASISLDVSQLYALVDQFYLSVFRFFFVKHFFIRFSFFRQTSIDVKRAVSIQHRLIWFCRIKISDTYREPKKNKRKNTDNQVETI